MPQPHQPLLHDLVTVCSAPTQVLSGRDGSVEAHGEAPSAQGVIHADVRVVSALRVRVDGRQGEHIATRIDGSRATFTSLLRHVGAGLGASADPQVRLDHDREVKAGSVHEALRISSVLAEPVRVRVVVELSSDLAPMEVLKVGAASEPLPLPDPVDETLSWGDGAGRGPWPRRTSLRPYELPALSSPSPGRC